MMLCLRFRMDGRSFGLDAGKLEELAPWIELWPLKPAPGFIAGCFSYRGETVPVVDMSALLCGKPSKRAFSTRIAVARCESRFVGMLLEDALETFQLGEAELKAPCVRQEAMPCLGRMAVRDGELLQLVDPDALLDEKAKGLLFPLPEGRP